MTIFPITAYLFWNRFIFGHLLDIQQLFRGYISPMENNLVEI